MIALTGGDVVLPDRVLTAGSLLIDPSTGTIAAIESRVVDGSGGRVAVDCRGHTLVPGFIDVHVHGVAGVDVLDGAGSVAAVAARLPKYGVTSFCPTSVACTPAVLQALLEEIASVRAAPGPASARVLAAHLESNFINPEWRGAQPLECLRAFKVQRSPGHAPDRDDAPGSFTGDEILTLIARRRTEVGIVTVAPEVGDGIDLVRVLAAAGHIVSIGHSGATYEQARAGIEAGIRHATHLFNRMSPLGHRAPGATGAALESPGVVAEIICDGFHVHPAMVALALKAKGAPGIVAITDGTAGSGLAVGTRARLGGRPIVVTSRTAELDDGTIAGSVVTMDGAFRMLVRRVGLPLPVAAALCAATPAAHLGLAGGRLAAGLAADVTVLDADLRVRQTFIAGRPALEPPLDGLRLSGVAP